MSDGQSLIPVPCLPSPGPRSLCQLRSGWPIRWGHAGLQSSRMSLLWLSICSVTGASTKLSRSDSWTQSCPRPHKYLNKPHDCSQYLSPPPYPFSKLTGQSLGGTAERQTACRGALQVDTALSQSRVPEAEAVSKLIKQMFSGSLGEPFFRRMASLEGIAVLIQPQWDGGGGGIWSTVEPLNTHHPFVRSVVQSCDQHIFSMLLSACGASGQNLK